MQQSSITPVLKKYISIGVKGFLILLYIILWVSLDWSYQKISYRVESNLSKLKSSCFYKDVEPSYFEQDVCLYLPNCTGLIDPGISSKSSCWWGNYANLDFFMGDRILTTTSVVATEICVLRNGLFTRLMHYETYSITSLCLTGSEQYWLLLGGCNRTYSKIVFNGQYEQQEPILNIEQFWSTRNVRCVDSDKSSVIEIFFKMIGFILFGHKLLMFLVPILVGKLTHKGKTQDHDNIKFQLMVIDEN